VTRIHIDDMYESGFDGAYTYFASEGFTAGSTIAHWRDFATACSLKNMMFVPSVGPGYDDTPVRPWNFEATKRRSNGAYYEEMFKAGAVLDPAPAFLSITSFNEWGEGTQIESAVPHSHPDPEESYNNYQPDYPEFYLDATARFTKLYFHKKVIPHEKD